MKAVERIGCLNRGWSRINFSIQWLDPSGRWQTSAWNSGNFENGAFRVSPSLSSLGVPEDAIGVTPYVVAALGASGRGAPLVKPDRNDKTAAYEVSSDGLGISVGPLPWRNWAQNLAHALEIDGEYYFTPSNRSELSQLVRTAAAEGVSLRVSGQRNAQPPLVTDEARSAPDPKRWLVDLSCYRDLGANGSDSIVLDAAAGRVTVNAGVREDALDAFLTSHDLMLRTVTAGGFFSIGGMTAVDVHGASLDAPIFAETATAFDIMGADGEVSRIDAETAAFGAWSPLQFARVSLGALGVVTAVTLEVEPRPWATSLSPGKNNQIVCSNAQSFISQFNALLHAHDRVETFFNPYSGRFLVLWWDVLKEPPTRLPNRQTDVPSACTLAGQEVFGAPYLGLLEPAVETLLVATQYGGIESAASTIIDTGYATIEGLFDTASRVHSDLWLTEASRVIFMSYFIELPALDEAGLAKAWEGLSAVTDRLRAKRDFLLVAPMEFRFIRGGNSALAGTYSSSSEAVFVNLDLIAYVPAVAADQYPAELLRFFADVERAWRALGGEPHSGKMFGFYDPAASPDTFSAPFNSGFLKDLAQRRGSRSQAFEAYRESRDPKGVFLNPFVGALLGRTS
jgi:FAD/FMN-containing dehydrogenase